MVAPRFAKLFAIAVSAALVCSMAGVPAYALTDTNLDEMAGASAGVSAITPTSTDESSSLQNQPSADDAESMPDNPTKDLPQTVSEAVPDDATVVSEELAVTDAGEVMDLETGDTVTDPQLVGTVDKPADPLAKTDGESFIPVEVAEVKEAMGDAAAEAEPDDAADTEDDGDVAETQRDAADDGAAGAMVRPAALQNNSYGAYWGTYNGTPAFFEADGTLFVQQAKGVIDVSEWQGQIDWQKAKNDGVEGAIIRISYGWDNGFDKQALRNISECKRLDIPFGIYSYSYAYDSTTAAYEGADMVSLLRQAGVQPGDLSYPVFYDLEKWTWTGHTPPTSPSVYDGIVNAWYAKLQAAGYNNLSVYSYTNYLDIALNSANIRNKTRWVASYGARTNFPFSTNDRGWQYTSGGSIDGIDGRVDLNAFGYYRPSSAELINSVGSKYAEYLGKPTGDIVCETSSRCWRMYEKGAVDWSTATGAHATWGEIRTTWLGEGAKVSRYELPVSDPQWFSENGGGWAQDFQNGSLHYQDGSKVFAVMSGPIRSEYVAQGFQAGFLGWPVSGAELVSGGGSLQRFQHGVIVSDGSNGFRVDGDILSLWERLGVSEVGLPSSDTVWWDENGGGWVQQFARGSIHWTGSTGAVFVESGPIQREYVAQGFQAGFLGWPVSGAELVSGGGSLQRFQHGVIVSDGSNALTTRY